MKWLVDGYNLLHASHIFAREGQGQLHYARLALLDHLAACLSTADRPLTTIVFDAKEAPAGLPDRCEHGGMVVRFARDHAEADDLIELLVQQSAAPRHLTVVSNDRRLQRAARRRRCRWTCCEVWLENLQPESSPGTDRAVPPRQGPLEPPSDALFPPEYLEELKRLEREWKKR